MITIRETPHRTSYARQPVVLSRWSNVCVRGLPVTGARNLRVSVMLFSSGDGAWYRYRMTGPGPTPVGPCLPRPRVATEFSD